MAINTEAHHAAWLVPGGWFVSCCWGRGRTFDRVQIEKLVVQLPKDPAEDDCCARLFRRIAAELANAK